MCIDPTAIFAGNAAATEKAPAIALRGCDDPEVIDLAILGHKVGSAPEKLAKYATRFVAIARDTMAEMTAATAAGNLPTVKALAHRLSSTASAVGAMRFGNLCREIEELALGDPTKMQDRIAQLELLLDRIAERVEAIRVIHAGA